MSIRQWTDEEWKKFQVRIEEATHIKEVDAIVKFTIGQLEHPGWYESPCECDLCRSYGDG